MASPTGPTTTAWPASPTRRSSSSKEIHDLIEGQIEELNSKINRWETIKKFAILDHDLSIENGEITPSMKVKRNVVEANNKAILDGFYA